jgi:hypothetical protein
MGTVVVYVPSEPNTRMGVSMGETAQRSSST